MSEKPRIERDVDELLRALQGPPAPPEAPPWPDEEPAVVPLRPRWRPLGVGVAGLALAAAALLAVRILPGETPANTGFRGAAPEAAPAVELWLAVERSGAAAPLVPGDPVAVGERVFFRVAAAPAAAVAVWAESAGGTEALGQIQADPAGADLADAAGLVAWRFDAAGPVVFRARAGGRGPCAPPSCAEIEVEAR